MKQYVTLSVHVKRMCAFNAREALYPLNGWYKANLCREHLKRLHAILWPYMAMF